MNVKVKNYAIKALFLFVGLLASKELFAHVKWFSSFDFLDKSKEISEVMTPVFGGLVVLSIVVASLLIVLDKKIEQTAIIQNLNNWLDKRQKYATDVLRIAMAFVLVISWVSGTILTPELKIEGEFMHWAEFFIAILLLIPATIELAGGLLLALYLFCIYQFGFFHMLDYLHFVGIGIYLLTVNSKNGKVASIGIPALYSTLGFALIWLACEKLFYPAWSLYLLDEYPVLALGLPHDFFLQGAAFVEIGLGFMLLIGALARPLAAVITVVFILTALVFGKVEIMGHTSLHAMLIVFILKGTESCYKAPITRMKSIPKKLLTAVVSYLLILGVMLFAYKFVANYQYEVAKSKAQATCPFHNPNSHSARMLDVANSDRIPKITKMEILEEPEDMGYDIHIETENWKFTPENVGKPYTENEGHIHVYLDGQKAGRMYSNYFYLGKLTKGKHKVAITINGDD
ncbi:MAG: hypothetical protein KGV44_13765, partial [Flavobacteriaceae bacterium]|nr:hypothetical protein [Flavobacteriaceae bacterium]